MLYQLGYYNKNVHKDITNDNFDGIQGTNFKKALGWFQKDNNLTVDKIYGPKSDAKLKNVYNKFMKEPIDWNDPVLANFQKNDFACKCCKVNKTVKKIIYNIQAVRHHLNVPVIPTCGYRCKKHNAEVGGYKYSKHMEGKAIDFYCSKTSTLSERKKIIDFYIKYFPNAHYAYCNGYGRGKTYTNKPSYKTMGSSVHIDVN